MLFICHFSSSVGGQSLREGQHLGGVQNFEGSKNLGFNILGWSKFGLVKFVGNLKCLGVQFFGGKYFGSRKILGGQHF